MFRVGQTFRPFRWIEPEQLHITLKFLGHLPEAVVPSLVEETRQGCRGIAPFELSLRGMGFFPHPKRAQIFWMGVDGNLAALASVQEAAEHAAATHGIEKEQRPFHAHITIGRARPPGIDLSQWFCAFPRQQKTWTVREIVLKQSFLSPKGSTYRDIEVVRLEG